MSLRVPKIVPFVLALWCGLYVFGCGGRSFSGQRSAQGGAGVAQQDGGSTGGATAGTTGTSVAVCAAVNYVEAPTLSTDCAVTVRQIDPTFTCGGANCAITKALDLTCAFLPQGPWLAATTDGAVVMTHATSPATNLDLTRLMTVETVDSRVQDVTALADPSLETSAASVYLEDSAMALSSSGARWLFVGDLADITVLRGTDAGWTQTVVPAPGGPGQSTVLNETLRVTDVRMVDDSLGYLTYSRAVGLPSTAHLLSWDGSCWSDQTIGPTWTNSIVVKADAERRPWVVWAGNRNVLNFRNPTGDVLNLLAGDPDASLAWGIPEAPTLRLLPGGLDGAVAVPAVAAKFADGIRVLSNTGTSHSDWSSMLLPESAYDATITGNCPPDGASSAARVCATLTSCTQQLNGASAGFDLVRTQSGATFAAWVKYSAQGSYALTYYFQGGEMPMDYCFKSETSGSGTAELVLARLTEAGPNLTRFHFDLGGAVASVLRPVQMAARGDTLLVAAYLSGDTISTLSYLEIDSRQLP